MKSFQKRFAIFALIFLVFQILQFLIIQNKAFAWTTSRSFLKPEGCEIFQDQVTDTTLRITWNLSACNWIDKVDPPTSNNGVLVGLFDLSDNKLGSWGFQGYSGTITIPVTPNTDYKIILKEGSYDGVYLNKWLLVSTCGAPDWFSSCTNGTLNGLWIYGTTKTLSDGIHLTASISPQSSGTINGIKDVYTSGELAQITTVPAAGYIFDRWIVEGGNTYYQNPLSLSMTRDYTVTAYFKARYSVTANVTGTGTGSVSGTGTYTEGATASLTATPISGSQFTGWTGDCSGTGVCSLVMNGNKSVTANFDTTPAPQYVLTVTKTGNGVGNVITSPSGIGGSVLTAPYIENTEVTLTANTDANSEFTGWSGDCSGISPCTITMNTAKNVTANFNILPSDYSLTVNKEGTGTGSITSSGSINDESLTANIARGEGLILTATPASGSIFSGWAGECFGTDTCTVTMDEVKNVHAVFNLYEAGDLSQPNTVKVINGIEIMFIDELPTGETEVSFTVEEKERGSNYPQNYLLKKLYSIDVVGGTGATIENGFNASITIPFSPTTGMLSSKYKIMYWNGSEWSSEGITKISFDIEAGKANFYTNHFSDFAVFEETTPSALAEVLPKAGKDFSEILLYNLLVAFVLQFLIVGILKKSKYSYLVS